MGFRDLFRKEPNDKEKKAAMMVSVMVGLVDHAEAETETLLGEVPSNLKRLFDMVRGIGDEFFAAYNNREWGNLPAAMEAVRAYFDLTREHMEEIGLGDQFREAAEASTEIG